MRRMQQVCADTQIALDKRAHRVALSSAEQSLLEAHLPACTVCCTFEGNLEETENVMQAHAKALSRHLDFSSLSDAAYAAVRKQKRGMARGLIGLAGFEGLCVFLYAKTGNPEALWIALSMLAICAFALFADLARLKLTRTWAERPPRLDVGEARRERKAAVLKLALFGLLAWAPVPLPGTVGHGLQLAAELVGLVGVFHYVFVIRALSRELKALRD